MVKDPNIYVWINLLLFRGVESKHSMALYEFVKDYIKIGRFHLKVPQFRKLMGIKDNQYKIFTMLEKRVLKVGIDELNEKTDLEIQYSLERKGRKVEAIKLRMKYKDSGKLAAFEK